MPLHSHVQEKGFVSLPNEKILDDNSPTYVHIMYMYMYISILYMHACMHAYIYTYMHTYIHTCHMGEAYIKGAYSTDKTHVALGSHEQRVIDCPYDKIPVTSMVIVSPSCGIM